MGDSLVVLEGDSLVDLVGDNLLKYYCVLIIEFKIFTSMLRALAADTLVVVGNLVGPEEDSLAGLGGDNRRSSFSKKANSRTEGIE